MNRLPALRFAAPLRALAACAMLAFLLQPALAHGFKIGSIEIGHPWSRATPPGAKVGGGYLTITNEGDTPDRLVSAAADVSNRIEFHEMAVKDGVMTMRPVPGGIEIPAHGTVKFGPGGYHIMFFDLAKPLVKGEKIAGTLTFEKAGTVKIVFTVDAIGATPAHDEMHGMSDAE